MHFRKANKHHLLKNYMHLNLNSRAQHNKTYSDPQTMLFNLAGDKLQTAIATMIDTQLCMCIFV